MRSSGKTMITVVAALGMASAVAMAGDGKDKPPAAPAGGMAKPPAPTKPMPDKTPVAPKPPEKPAAPMGMTMPTPAPELVEAAKMLKGTWSCKGTVHMPDGTSRDSVGSMKVSVDLDKFWITTDMTEKGKTPYKFLTHMTFDASSKKWTQVMVDNMGSFGMATSDGPKDGAVSWLGETHGMGMVMKSKLVETMVSPKERKLVSSGSMDGKTWMVDYEGTCKK